MLRRIRLIFPASEVDFAIPHSYGKASTESSRVRFVRFGPDVKSQEPETSMVTASCALADHPNVR